MGRGREERNIASGPLNNRQQDFNDKVKKKVSSLKPCKLYISFLCVPPLCVFNVFLILEILLDKPRCDFATLFKGRDPEAHEFNVGTKNPHTRQVFYYFDNKETDGGFCVNAIS